MALPNFAWALNVTTAITICQLYAPGSNQKFTPGPGSSQMLDLVSYSIYAGSTGVGTVLTFNELWPDGTLQAMTTPAAITLTNSGVFSGTINGPFLGIAIVVSNPVGNGIARAMLKSAIRSL